MHEVVGHAVRCRPQPLGKNSEKPPGTTSSSRVGCLPPVAPRRTLPAKVAFEAHGRHGTFELANYGELVPSYTVGAVDVAVKYGARTPAPPNLYPADPGRDYGDYCVMRRVTFTVVNPTDAQHVVYL